MPTQLVTARTSDLRGRLNPLSWADRWADPIRCIKMLIADLADLVKLTDYDLRFTTSMQLILH